MTLGVEYTAAEMMSMAKFCLVASANPATLNFHLLQEKTLNYLIFSPSIFSSRENINKREMGNQIIGIPVYKDYFT